MPLPLPIMIPFMMWQSAAIAAGFGTYFQFAKRRVSAMSNEDFNKANPHELVNSMYEDIVKQIPSSFSKVDSLTPIMLESMNTMLDQAVKWLAGAVTGNFFGTPNPVNEQIDNLGDPTPELSTELLDPSFQTVKSWTSTKLNLVHDFQMNQYSSQAQGFIHSVHDFNKKQKEPEIAGTKLNTLNGHLIFAKPDFPNPNVVSSLQLDALNNATDLRSWTLHAARLFAAAKKQQSKGGSNTFKIFIAKVIANWVWMISKQNKANESQF